MLLQSCGQPIDPWRARPLLQWRLKVGVQLRPLTATHGSSVSTSAIRPTPTWPTPEVWRCTELVAGYGMGNLEQILGYQGAVRTGEATLVGQDIVQMPFWTPEFCATLIQAAQAAGGFSHQPDDPVPGYEISLAAIAPRLFEAVEQDIGMRLWPEIRRWWPIVDYHGVHDAFVIRYAMGEQEELRLHHDVAQVSASIKLNDSYVGGELEFPRQNFTNSDVPVGNIIVWPSLVTHPHRGAPLVNGEKYSLTVWCALPLVID